MQLSKMLKDTITNHKKKIELTQWAIIAGISSIVYPEYISNIKQKRRPVRRIMVPSIKNLNEFLKKDGEFMQMLSDKFIESIRVNDLFYEYSDAEEFILFKDDNIEIMKVLFDLYIMPNIASSISQTISKKFGLDDPNQQLILQDNDINIFNMNKVSYDDILTFVTEETVLQLLMLIPTMKKEIELPGMPREIYMTGNEILTVGHENAICPIHFNKNIINGNDYIIDTLKFVTSISIDEVDWIDKSFMKHGNVVEYVIDSNVFNELSLTVLKGIEENTGS